jgi:hypothetical protein
MPVSAALQRKLLDRKLRNPLESCLMAEDGVTPQTLVQAAWQAAGRHHAAGRAAAPARAALMQEVAHLPLHSVAQLLLTAGPGLAPREPSTTRCRPWRWPAR